jgi:hypothetical protein
MRYLLFIALFNSLISFGQGGVALLYEEMPTDTIVPLSVEYHSSVKPAIRMQRPIDGLINIGLNEQLYFAHITPIADLNYRYNETSQYRTGGGLNLESSFSNKWYLRASFMGGVGSGDSLFHSKAYWYNADSTSYSYGDLRGRLSYTPNRIFNFQVGLDHNFIGEGNRSLFLSDYGKPHPFGQIRAQFWRVEYSVLYQFFREEVGTEWKRKNGATHHISLNATKWLNIGIFETVVFQPKDTLLNRGYDVEYLNPVIFYRPQEYSLGSSDNVLLGLSFSAKYKQHTLYGQFILDEFSLTEYKAKTGWWANKYGGQLGIKGRFATNKSNWFYRLEYNAVRPYTYAHLNEGQNYGNQGNTLAHPYASNFMEILGEVKFQHKRWIVKAFASYFLKGEDKNGLSYGGNLYQPYTNRPYEYGHFTGQGQGNNGLRIMATVAFKVHRHSDLQAFFENQLRYDTMTGDFKYLPTIGLRSQLWNDYRNY